MYARAKNIARAIVQSDESKIVHVAREEVASLFEPQVEPAHERELRRKLERERNVLILVLSHVLSHDIDPPLPTATATIHPNYTRPSILLSHNLQGLDVLSEEDETEEEGESTSTSESSSTSSTDMMNAASPVLDIRSATTRTLSSKSILKSQQQQPSSPQRITSQRRVQFAAQHEPSPSPVPEPIQQQAKPRRKPAPPAPAVAPHPYQLAFNKRKQFWLPPKAHAQSPMVVQADDGRTDVAIAELVQ
ncbi:hypothetical protein EXIGLDRAFT_804810 [Exidia glandulosa HHB12029]|uniref:Uncharacterized protein n=1 Tax=Exidia glandulosa HHB12029 TaxID=1314781 RepID=A0A165DU06_EXIGL|nr:hypothetical protein EXIGLDRAFT_804810 [Exidia glandulosa HHB12029]